MAPKSIKSFCNWLLRLRKVKMSSSPHKSARCDDKICDELVNPTAEMVKDECAVANRFEELFNSPHFSDIRLNICGDVYYAHKFLLVTASEVFNAMLNEERWRESRQPEIELNETDECIPVFGQFLKYIYCGKVELTTDTTLPILLLADKYSLSSLRKSCVDYMLRHIVESPDTNRTLTWYQYAKMTNQDELAANCLKFITSNFDLILRTADWLDVSDSEVEEFLKNSELLVSSEAALWKEVEKWLVVSESRLEKTEDNLAKIIPLLRFSMMTPRQLLDIESSNLCHNNPDIFSPPLNAAYRYHSLSSDVLTDIGKEPYRNYTDDSYSICCKIGLQKYREVTKINSKIDAMFDVPIVYAAPSRTVVKKFTFRVEFFSKGYFSAYSLYGRYLGRQTDMTMMNIDCTVTPDLALKVEFTIVFYGKKKDLEYVVYTYHGAHTFSRDSCGAVVENVIPLKLLTQKDSVYLIDGNLVGSIFIKVQKVIQTSQNFNN
ncbi:BTB/POZ domain-containing protein 17 isoform X2 [Octopus bimaculoides]|uniref:BTB/POZ domain-containing protein 17 isoform X2 n=1 Tax=Octopus bimaculoides TaxID=37653 RepID=UPI00071D5309|nr:BTB/POZ domain-containing protein 17 isoform X2 [Octopus bimaculoides]|eukprot:XP_014775741.1 PREDICTED: BTB/POZ domain-containing protein 17-like isoform X1 [Octopus bimaculoides]